MLKKPHWLIVSTVATLFVIVPFNCPTLLAAVATKAPVPVLPPNPLDITAKCGSPLAMTAGVWQNSADGEKRIRRLEFDDAKKELAQLRARSPQYQRFAQHAVDALTAKGWRKAPELDGGSDVVVIQIQKKVTSEAATVSAPASLLSRVAAFFFPAVAAQSETAYLAEGEFWYSSWDDGDPLTWEGQIGVYEYSMGNYGDGGAQFRNDGSYPPGTMYGTEAVTWESGNVSQPGWTAQPYKRGLGALIGCSVSGCFIGAGGCILFGPATINCALVRCGLSTAGCIISTYLTMALDGQRTCRPSIWGPCTNMN